MTPRDRAREAIATAFRERFARGLAHPDKRWPDAIPSADELTVFVKKCVDHMEDALDAYRVPRASRTAMAVRLAAQWEVWGLFGSGTLHKIGGIFGDESRGCRQWPSNISLDEARATIERSKHPDARIVARSMREGKWEIGVPDRIGIGAVEIRLEAHLPHPTIEGFVVVEPELRAALDSHVFHPLNAALVAWAAKVVADDQRNARQFALPASRASRVAFEFMARQKALTTDERSNAVEAIAGGGVRVFWDGKPRAEQLTFAFAARDATLRTAFEIVDELGAEGLRDYVILHRMAAAQGRTGTFRWTWEAHRHATRHATRVRSSNTTDDEAREAVVQRLWRLTRAELHVEVERDGRRAWKVVGDDPLVYVTGGVEQGGRIEGMTLRLNKALYEGATRGNKKPYFTPLPEAVLDLPATAFCLAVMLSFSWRYAHDAGGVVELSADDLQRAMDTTESSRARSRHRTAAAAHARDTLDRVAAAMGDGCRWEPVEGGKYRVTPPRFWVDSVVHGATPVLPPTTKGAPTTGLQLVAWREKHKLSQVAAAGVLGVGVQTIKRAELVPGAALPRAFLKANWGSVTRRGLPKPVEGGDST